MKGISSRSINRRLAAARAIALTLLISVSGLAVEAMASTPASSSPVWLGTLGGTQYFIARPVQSASGLTSALYKTDGTTAGTSLVAPIDGAGILTYQAGTLFMGAGTKAYFLAFTDATQQQVWATDGTPAGTHQIANIAGESGYSPMLLGLIGTNLIFTEATSENTAQLFLTDGTAAGTVTLSHFAQSQYLLVSDSLAIDGKVFVALESGVSCCQPDLWVTDGTAAGTVKIDSNEGAPFHLNASSLQPFGSSVALLTDTTSTEPSFVNVATNGLTILGVEPPAYYGGTIASMNGFILYLSGDPNDGLQLWRSDGTLAGTTLVRDMGAAVQFSQLSYMVPMARVGNHALFQAENGSASPQLWSSDGTAQGTVSLISTPTPNNLYVQPLIGVAGTHAYYAVYTGSDYRLVATDGTPAGTHLLTDAGPLDPNGLTNTYVSGDDNLAFFYTYYFDQVSGNTKHLYSYHPQTNVLTHLRDSPVLAEDVQPLDYAGILYFSSVDSIHGEQPWVSDGTVDGTHILADLDNNAPIGISSTSLSFASTNLGTASAAQTATLTNISIATISLSAVTVTGQSDDFIVTNTCGSALSAGASCTLSVSFKPVSTGKKSARINLPYSAGGSPLSIALNGSATSSQSSTLTLSAGAVAFGNQAINRASSTQSIVLTNTGAISINFTAFNVTGQADDFIVTNTCGTALTAAANCALTVAFKPVSLGSKSATISIADNASGSPQSVTLTGTGTTGTPTLSLSAAALSFPTTAPGATSAAQTVTVTNTGPGALTLSSIAVTGGQADDFAVSSGCGTSLSAGTGCTLTISFKPVSAGSKAAALTLTDSAGNSPQRIALAGTGI